MHPLSLLLLALTLSIPSIESVKAQSSPTTNQADESPGALRAGDVIRVRIWREPDLSGEFQVDEQGEAVFPKIGAVSVLGLQPDSLKARLIALYSSYLRNPAIEVIPLRRITILGGVRNPGLYPVDLTMTLADAFALAGGVSPEAKPDQVELVRGGQRTRFKITSETRIADTPVRSGDQLYVPTRGWVARNPWVVTAGLTAVVTVLVAFVR
jgi:protein involved in polysaccharide export with SLBB domain